MNNLLVPRTVLENMIEFNSIQLESIITIIQDFIRNGEVVIILETINSSNNQSVFNNLNDLNEWLVRELEIVFPEEI